MARFRPAPPSPPGLGDLLRAAQRLRVDSDEQLARLARLLGVAARHVPHERTHSPPTRTQPATPTREPGGGARLKAQQDSAARELASGMPHGGAATAAYLTQALPAPTAAPSAPAWLNAVASLPKSQTLPLAQPDALLMPASERAVLGALAATRLEDGEPDLARLIDQLAAREALQRLPRQRCWALRNGLQVLVDRGPEMAPFDADVQALLAGLRRLLPPSGLHVLAFVGEPLRGCQQPGAEGSTPWLAPPPGTPVLVLSVLGLGQRHGPATPASLWLRFCQAAAQGGHPLRALVPYAPARWPRPLATQLNALHWDRELSTGAVRRTLQR